VTGTPSAPVAWTEQVTAISTLVTAVSAVVVAGVGGYWALFRYKREDPYLPRINATVGASLFSEEGIDYISFDATVSHVAGSALSIVQDDGEGPRVEVRRLTTTSDVGGLPAVVVLTCAALERDQELAAGESTHEEGVVALGRRAEGTIGYEVRFTFTGAWLQESWTWSPNKILLARPGG
jgi:hypothetical protein